jgi:hypothetical protein
VSDFSDLSVGAESMLLMVLQLYFYYELMLCDVYVEALEMLEILELVDARWKRR